MNKIDNIMSELDCEMKQFNVKMQQMLSSEIPIVKEAVSYIFASQGKQVRPLLVILTAKLNGEVCEKTHLSSCLIELTHCASLIHDDIVDEAYMRRGMLSAYAIWRNRNSVLIGDYIFSRAIKLSCHNQLYGLLKKISTVIENMSVGELEQSEAAQKLNINEQKYYDIVNGKTAELISTCSYAGAKSANASEEMQERMSDFGRILGFIFQIKDDMLDFATDGKTGKSPCNDIKEQKITLPLIVALRESDSSTQRHILSHIVKAKTDNKSLRIVSEFVISSNSMSYCEAKLSELREQAVSLLEVYPDSKYKDLLIGLVDFFIERTK